MKGVVAVNKGLKVIIEIFCLLHLLKYPSQLIQQPFSLFGGELSGYDMGAEAFNGTADLDGFLHVLIRQVAEHKSLAGDDRNISILA